MLQIEPKMKELPPELQNEVEDLIEFLLVRRRAKSGNKLRQDWAGALRDFRDQYTSLDLQKKIAGLAGRLINVSDRHQYLA